jgi:hypothetical protein
MARRIKFFFEFGFATEIDGRCYLRRKTPFGFDTKEVTGSDPVVGWFTIPSCDTSAIKLQAQRWGLGALSIPNERNGWTVIRQSGQCGTQNATTALISNQMYSQKFIATLAGSNENAWWEAVEAEANKTDEEICGTLPPPPQPESTFTEFTGRYDTPITENLNWRIVAAVAILIITGLYALKLSRE